jgi:hypothetical protein
MKLKIPMPIPKRQRIVNKVNQLARWHATFAVWPKRIDVETVVFLEYCARRIKRDKLDYCLQHPPTTPKWGDWEYGPLTKLLEEQPR